MAKPSTVSSSAVAGHAVPLNLFSAVPIRLRRCWPVDSEHERAELVGPGPHDLLRLHMDHAARASNPGDDTVSTLSGADIEQLQKHAETMAELISELSFGSIPVRGRTLCGCK